MFEDQNNSPVSPPTINPPPPINPAPTFPQTPPPPLNPENLAATFIPEPPVAVTPPPEPVVVAPPPPPNDIAPPVVPAPIDPISALVAELDATTSSPLVPEPVAPLTPEVQPIPAPAATETEPVPTVTPSSTSVTPLTPETPPIPTPVTTEPQPSAVPTPEPALDFPAKEFAEETSIKDLPLAPTDTNPGTGKSRLLAAFLAIFFGFIGAHQFYLGSPQAGLQRIFISLISFGIGGFIWGVIEGLAILRGQSYTTDATGHPLV